MRSCCKLTDEILFLMVVGCRVYKAIGRVAASKAGELGEPVDHALVMNSGVGVY